MVLVNRLAPDFTASAVLSNGTIINNFNLKSYTYGKLAVIFFWPMDFTFVCPSEIIACNKRYSEFQKRQTNVIGISIDSEFVHKAWRQTPIEKGGIGEIQFPIISDIKHEIIKSYGIQHPEMGIALRGSFLIDQKNIVRHQVVNDLPIGRNFDEMLRMIDALIFYQKYGEVCPAQWKNNKKGITPTQEGVSKYLSENLKNL